MECPLASQEGNGGLPLSASSQSEENVDEIPKTMKTVVEPIFLVT